MSAGIAPGLRAAVLVKKEAIAEEWLARTLRAYPEQTSRFLMRERDPFRNPLVPAMEKALPALVDELLGDMDAAVLASWLDRVIRYRAVQDLDPDAAVGFVFLLKPVVREVLAAEAGPGLWADRLGPLDARIDELALRASEALAARRERMREIKANEAIRRVAVLTRMRARKTPMGQQAPGG